MKKSLEFLGTIIAASIGTFVGLGAACAILKLAEDAIDEDDCPDEELCDGECETCSCCDHCELAGDCVPLAERREKEAAELMAEDAKADATQAAAPAEPAAEPAEKDPAEFGAF